MPISALIHTKNSAATLEKALKSVAFADEVVVIDMGSNDDTLKIARQHKAKIALFEDVGYVEPARNFAFTQASHEWLLVLDADEEVPKSLQQTLIDISLQPSDTVAYYIPRKNLIFNSWVQHTGWWPDYQLRFFKKGSVSWPKKIHAQPDIKGQTAHLEATADNAILHHNYPTVAGFIDRLNRYTSFEAKDRQLTEKSTSSQLLNTFFEEFISRYFAQQGFQDGPHGMSLSLLQGMYMMTMQLKAWEKSGFETSKENPEKAFAAIRQIQKQLNYWMAQIHVEETTGLEQVWWKIRRKWQF